MYKMSEYLQGVLAWLSSFAAKKGLKTEYNTIFGDVMFVF